MAELTPEQSLPVPDADLTRIASVVQEHHELKESEPEVGREAIRTTLQSLAGVQNPAPAPAQPTTSTTLPDYLTQAPEGVRQQVEHLIETAKAKGIDAAHEAAKKTDPFVLDAFHDVMSGKLYRAFKDRGLLQ